MSLASQSATRNPAEGITPSVSRLTGNRLLIAFNPIAGAGGRRAKVAALMARLREWGFEPTLCDNIDALVKLACEWAAAGELRGVIAAGGDGTASLVLNRLPPGTPIATFPLGTENLLARYLGHSSRPEKLIELLREGIAIDLDAGEANGCLFSLMAGCGFDAEVVDRLHRERRGPISHWSYIKPMLRTIRSYTYPALRVSVDGGDPIECRWAFVVNIPRYACGVSLDPAASPLDGQLNVVTFRAGSLFSGLINLAAVYLRRHRGRYGVEFHQARQVRIESPELARFQLDGDPGGELPVDIRCIPARLRMIVLAEWLKTNGGGLL